MRYLKSMLLVVIFLKGHFLDKHEQVHWSCLLFQCVAEKVERRAGVVLLPVYICNDL